MTEKFEQLSADRQRRIIEACREYEESRLDITPPSMQEFLERVPDEDRTDVLLELVAIDIELRLAASEETSIEDYVRQFPEHAESIGSTYAEVIGSIPVNQWPLAATGGSERLGDFVVVREIGRGGMGIVYEAIQESLQRRVALKVLPKHALLAGTAHQRFEREARAVARLHHNHIAEIYGTGEQGNVRYFAMQFISGSSLQSLIERLRSACPQPESAVRFVVALSDEEKHHRVATRIGQQIAEALHYAHGEGVLHRDIKPSNIMLDVQGKAWLTDFGLAKLLHEETGENLTEHGDVVGTLRYMAPETLRGQADGRSDVYSLGLTLFELLARRPAFGDVGREELLNQRLTAESPRLDAAVPHLPKDLVTIIQKSIDRESAARYQTAGELADDLRRFLNDEPIRARRVSQWERFRRWGRRNPLLASLILATFVLLNFSLVGSLIAAFHFKTLEGEQRQLAGEKGRLAEHNAKLAEQNGTLAREAQTERDRSTLLLADVLAKQGLNAAEEGNEREALLLFAGSAEKCQSLDSRRYRANVTRFQAVTRQMATLDQLLPWFDSAVPLSYSFHPQGDFVLARHRTMPRQVPIDIATGLEMRLPFSNQEIGGIAWTNDGTRLLVGGIGKITSLRFPQLDEPIVIDNVTPTASLVHLVATDLTGRYVAIASGADMRLWHNERNQFLGPPITQAKPIQEFVFSSDGEWLASVNQDNQLQAFATSQFGTAEVPVQPKFTGSHVMDDRGLRAPPRFLRRNSVLLTYPDAGQLELHELATPDRPQRIHHDLWQLTTLEPIDEELVFVGGIKGGGFLRLADQPPAIEQARDFAGEIFAATYNPVRRELIVGYSNRNTECWLLSERKRLPFPFTAVSGCVLAVHSPDHTRLLTTGIGAGQHSCLWKPPPTGLPQPNASGMYPMAIRRAAFSPNSRFVAVSDGIGRIVVQDLETHRQVGAIRLEPPAPIPFAIPLFLPDNERLLASVWLSPQQRELRVWNWRTGALLQTLPAPVEADAPHDSPMLVTADHKQLFVSLGKRRTAICVDLTQQELVAQTIGFENLASVFAISPDGHWVAGAQNDGGIWLMPRPTTADPQPNRQSIGLFTGFGWRMDFKFSWDMRRIAVSSRDAVVALWDLPQPISTLSPLSPPVTLNHPSGLHYSEFSADNRHLLTVSRDATARVWETDSGRMVGAPITSKNDIGARFRPHHDELLTVDYEGRFDVWDWHSTTKLWPSQPLMKNPGAIWGGIRSLTLSPNGRFAAIGGNGELSLIDLAPLDATDLPSPADLRLQAERLSGMRLLDNGNASKLTNEEWLSRVKPD